MSLVIFQNMVPPLKMASESEESCRQTEPVTERLPQEKGITGALAVTTRTIPGVAMALGVQ